MKIEEVTKVLDLVFNGMDEDVININYKFFEKDYSNDDIGYLEIDLYVYYDNAHITKDLYFDKNTRELIPNYERKIILKREIESLQKELEELEKLE